MKCPHCEKEFRAPDAALINAEHYGGCYSHVVSRCCGKAVHIVTGRRVTIEVIGKGDESKTEVWR